LIIYDHKINTIQGETREKGKVKMGHDWSVTKRVCMISEISSLFLLFFETLPRCTRRHPPSALITTAPAPAGRRIPSTSHVPYPSPHFQQLDTPVGGLQ
jgi:hypothetical protein